jgi:probable rRNA maturation factor
MPPLPARAAPRPEMAVIVEPRPATVAIAVRVEAGVWPSRSALGALTRRVVDAATAALRPKLAAGAELSLLFTDDAHIRELNRRYRRIDRATNVLSFPAAVPAEARYCALLGDIALASETVRREAESQGLTIEAHLSHLIVHGFLHILGYDHANEAEASAMERLESGILRDLGIADPYARRR